MLVASLILDLLLELVHGETRVVWVNVWVVILVVVRMLRSNVGAMLLLLQVGVLHLEVIVIFRMYHLVLALRLLLARLTVMAVVI